MKILFDTHTFLWWTSEPSLLPGSLLEHVKNPENECYLSSVSTWEMQIKVGLRKLTLGEPLEKIVRREISKNGLKILPIHLNHTFQLKKLPPLHRDPFDRMLIAQALGERLTIATKDRFIQKYPHTETIWER